MSANPRNGFRAAGRIVSAPIQQVRWKIMAPYAVLTMVFAVLGTYLVTNLVTGSLQERFTNQLVEASRVTSDSVVRRERQHLAGLRAVAFTDGVAEAVETSDGPALAALVEPIVVNNRMERAEVLDARGSRLYGVQQPESAGALPSPLADAADRSAWPIVVDVLAGRKDASGDKWAGIVDTSDGPALYTAGPILRNGQIVGVVLAGSLLRSFLPVAKAEALAEVTVYSADGQPLESTFALSPTERAALQPRASLAVPGQPAAREPRQVFGRDYDLLYSDLRVRNEVVGRYSVALPTDYISGAGSTARWQMAALFAVITLAVLLLGWLLARHLTRPLLKLVRAARAVSSGDLSARSAVHTRDEIGMLAVTFDAMTEKLQRQHLATVGALASAIDARDPYTAGHSLRVGQLAADLGRQLGLPAVSVQHLQIGGYLHDVGKIGVRDNVLLKQGRLTDEERALIEQHPRIGLEILAPAELPGEVLAIVGRHHERLDGSGYPLKLTEDEITVFPRVVAVADVYDALTTDRPYRRAMEIRQAMHILRGEANDGMLDPEVVSALECIQSRWEERRRSDPILLGFNLPQEQQLRKGA